MRVLLLVSAFNGLSQRAWCALTEAGHDVGVLLATGPEEIVDGVRAAQPELVLCPYLKHRVPAEVWRKWRTVIIHPGPVGDRGPSSLDWAITEGASTWGVTALQAVEEMDAGPVWAHRTFAVPATPPRKSALYSGPVADAALECIAEVMAKAADPDFTPTPPQELAEPRPRPVMTQADRAFDWTEPTEHIVRRIRAADGFPGVRTQVAGLAVFAYDAHPGLALGTEPGAVLARRQGAVLVGTGDGAVWLGHLRAAEPGAGPAFKLPATALLGRRISGVPHAPVGPGGDAEQPSYRQIRYRRTGAVGWLVFDFYNGAMSTAHCRRLSAALRHAADQDTRVLVLRGGTDAFSNGIHLNVTEAATDPAGAAWANIKAINTVCREIIGCTRQTVVAAYAGSAGAGGAMLGLGADVVAARAGIVLNPYYDIGLYGSELHTFTLPRRVGAETARQLLDRRLPVSAERAATLGLVDEVGPRHPHAYTEWLAELAQRLADPRAARARRTAKAGALAAEPVPLDAYEAQELAEMSRDMFADRSGFAAARRAFVTKAAPDGTPQRLVARPTEPVRGARLSRQRTAAEDESGARVRPAVPMSA
ncbi:hydrogenase maturation protein [Krasilnikovia sp. MM14-A1004]|uniref:hydrogenase maturation protein n=1 Tax=Krasilnikovia sp. MM14-A1004 TaxID=3373541 RepID=UPI00399C520D